MDVTLGLGLNENFISLLTSLGELIFDCTQKVDNAHYEIFHGCYDWHSACHGHWALFRIALTCNTPQTLKYAQIIYQKYTPNAIEQEQQYLLQNPSFECPYGYAWFLRLFIDCKIWATTTSLEVSSPLKPIADIVSERLLTYLQSLDNLSPHKRGEYANTSWAITQLYNYFSFVKNVDHMKTVSAMLNPNTSYQNFSFEIDKSSKEFFSLFGNWIYCVGVIHGKEALHTAIKNHPVQLEHLEAMEEISSVHHLGINWSRAWALKLLARTFTDQNYNMYYSAFINHVQVGIQLHNKIQETKMWQTYPSYYAYDHWVPQFIVYALTDQ